MIPPNFAQVPPLSYQPQQQVSNQDHPYKFFQQDLNSFNNAKFSPSASFTSGVQQFNDISTSLNTQKANFNQNNFQPTASSWQLPVSQAPSLLLASQALFLSSNVNNCLEQPQKNLHGLPPLLSNSIAPPFPQLNNNQLPIRNHNIEPPSNLQLPSQV